MKRKFFRVFEVPANIHKYDKAETAEHDQEGNREIDRYASDKVAERIARAENVEARVAESRYRSKQSLPHAYAAAVPHERIDEKEKAYSLVGRPDELEWEDQVVAVLEARDGTILDVVRKIRPYSPEA